MKNICVVAKKMTRSGLKTAIYHSQILGNTHYQAPHVFSYTLNKFPTLALSLLLHSPLTLNSPLLLSIISRDSNSVVCIWGFSLHKLPALFDNLCMNVLREKVLASYFATVQCSAVQCTISKFIRKKM